jgi:putative ABC transport system permease protein
MSGIIELGIRQVMLSCAFVLAVLMIIEKRGIRRRKEVLISSVRMTLQLILAGYALGLVFARPHPAVTAGIIAAMEFFAVFTVYQKFKGKLSAGLKKAVAISMTAGTLSCLLYFLFVVVQIDPWYDPQYFIPIAGMLIGNSMTGISLGVKSLVENMTTQKSLVEEALILGATPKEATRSMIDSTFDAAIMPTINSMVGMGIVFLPGMMTGQILSGTLPTTAVAYQISIMFGILGAVALTVLLMLQMGYRSFFNDEDQLI